MFLLPPLATVLIGLAAEHSLAPAKWHQSEPYWVSQIGTYEAHQLT